MGSGSKREIIELRIINLTLNSFKLGSDVSIQAHNEGNGLVSIIVY